MHPGGRPPQAPVQVAEPRGSTPLGILFGFGWAIVGGGVSALTMTLFAIGSIGGVQTPDPIWWVFVKAGFFVVPWPLVLGGIPAARRIAQGRPWLKAAALAAGFALFVWTVVFVGFVAYAPSA